jgi:two-component system phosphate regulon response regulator OmpR
MKVKKTILVVDDDPAIVAMVTRILERDGWTTVSAGSESEALENDEVFESLGLAIVDFWLDRTPALSLLKAIGEKRTDLPVVVMSGGGEGVPLEVLHSVTSLSGALGFLQKPFSRVELLTKISDLIDP